MTPKDQTLLFLKMKSMDLTPNEYFYLVLLQKDQTNLLNYNIEQVEKSIVKKIGSIQKASMLVKAETQELYDLVDEYRSLFPRGRLPSGKAGRSTETEVTSKMKWFVINYPYCKDQIIRATTKYIQRYVETNYLYMQNASSFIYREDRTRIRQSSLLEAIQTEDLPTEEVSFGIDV